MSWPAEVMAHVAAQCDHVAICPGHRSTPLAMAAAARDDLTLHVILDERSAGFWALGVAKATGKPAAVITTSGTAVANLHPAVVEADMSNTPMLLLTADRPKRLRGTGVNQTIDQADLFGRHARASVDATEGPLPWATDGPVHLNLPFDKPLIQDAAPVPCPEPPLVPPPEPPIHLEGPGTIVAGPGPLPDWIVDVADRLGAALVADALSGLRRTDAMPEAPAWIIQVGGTPVDAELYEALAAFEGRRLRVAHGARRDLGTPEWITLTQLREATGGAPADPPAWTPEPLSWEGEALQGAMQWPGNLFLGNSLIAREAQKLPRRAGVHANRGASGIDGNIATAAGISVTGPTVAVVGDLAFQHDLGSLALVGPNLRIVVINNGGGQIFSRLPVAELPDFERLWLTPQNLAIEHAAAAFGLSYQRVRADAVAESTAQVVEVVP